MRVYPLAVSLALALAACSVAAAQESGPIVRGIVRDRMLKGKGMSSVQVSAKPPGNPRLTTSDGTFTLEFPQTHPGTPIHIVLQKSTDGAEEPYVVVNDVQLDTFLPDDPKHVLTFIMCKKSEREEYARHFYKMESFSSIEAGFAREFAKLKTEKEDLEQKLNAAQEGAPAQQKDLMRQIEKKDQSIARLQQGRDHAEALAESAADFLAAHSVDEVPGDGEQKVDLYRHAMRLFLDGNMDQALKLLDEKAINREFDLGNQEIASGQQHVQRGVDESLLRATMQISKLQFDEAETTYLHAISKAPTSFDAEYAYAQLNRVLHRPEAIGAFSKSVELADGNKAHAAMALLELGNTYAERGESGSAVDKLHEALTNYEALAQSNPIQFGPDLARTLIDLGIAERHLERAQESAKDHLDRAKNVIASLPDRESPTNLSLSGSAANTLGSLYYSQGKISEAKTEFEFAVAAADKLAEIDSRSHRKERALCLDNLSNAERSLGQLAPSIYLKNSLFSEADEHIEAAEKIWKELASEIPQVYGPDYVLNLTNLGLNYLNEGKFDQAEEKLKLARNIRADLASGHSARYQKDYAVTLTVLGALYVSRYQMTANPQFVRDALENLDEAVKILEPLARKNHGEFTVRLGESLNQIALVYCYQQQWDKARTEFKEELEHYQELSPQARAYLEFHTFASLGDMELLRGDKDAARRWYEQAQGQIELFSAAEKTLHKDDIRFIDLRLDELKATTETPPRNPR